MERIIINSIQELIKYDFRELDLYGAGTRSGRFIQYNEKSDNRIDILNIWVTTMKGNPGEMLGIPVHKFGEYSIEKSGNILVCVEEKYWADITREFEKREIEKAYFMGEGLWIDIEADREGLNNGAGMLLSMKSRIDSMEQSLMNALDCGAKITAITGIVLNIVDHCNLRCKGCNHFACIADEHYVDIKSIEKDLIKLSDVLDHDYVGWLGIQGGEPLLHPDLLEIVKIARQCFPYTEVSVDTNGLLLPQQGEDFYKVLRDNDVSIWATRYPINLDYEGCRKKAESEGVRFTYQEGTGGANVKRLFKWGVDLYALQEHRTNYLKCDFGSHILAVNEGKAYPCPFMHCAVNIFNKKFNQKLHIVKEDYIVIDEIQDKEELFSWMQTPKFFCRYCKGIVGDLNWTITDGLITEWV